LPVGQLIVVTGLSGSGKSSFAFDTLFAEGQRRYIETFSPYARQFFDRMDKPQVDSIEGIPPAIAIEQRNAVKTTRSTVGTMTEISDYMKLLWGHISQLHCRQCGQPVTKDSPQRVWEKIQKAKGREQRSEKQKESPSSRAEGGTDRKRLAGTSLPSESMARQALIPPSEAAEVLVTFDLPLTDKLSLEESLALVAKQGYQRILIDRKAMRLDEVVARSGNSRKFDCITVIQDRLRPVSTNRARFIEACEQAYHFGKGKLCIRSNDGSDFQKFSNRLHCAACDIDYKEPSPALFSFNHPVGACPTCKGFGRVISIDYDIALPDRSKTIAGGLVRPWQTGHGLESQTDMMRACKTLGIPTNVPFNKLSKKWQDFIINGDPEYGADEEHEWPRAWYGVKGYFRWLESKAYKMHVRVLLSRYRAYTTCTVCNGQRFQPDALLYFAANPAEPHQSKLTLADFYQLPIRDALKFIDTLAPSKKQKAGDPISLALDEVASRLRYLEEVGLGYLTLDRPTRSLSGGETERVNLTTCLGTRLVNTLFVLDEPSVGLHARDTQRLIKILEQLRDTGNTVVVVEHEASVMAAADQIVDLGPGHGATGGELVFQGSFKDIRKCKASLTGQYLSRAKAVEAPARRPVQLANGAPAESFRRLDEAYVLNDAARPFGAASLPSLRVVGATKHNLEDFSVEIPLHRFVCITGVSGSGKTTLLRDVLLPGLKSRMAQPPLVKTSERPDSDNSSDQDEDSETRISPSGVEGVENIGNAILVDQSALGKTPRSNPAVYIGAFDHVREFFAQSEVAKQRGLNASAFSFNSSQGQCQRCRGAGFEKIEMQFLSDVFVRCPDCDGRRYRAHILEIKIAPEGRSYSALSIADLLDSTVEGAIAFLGCFSDSKPARKAADSLKLLEEVGLGYLKLGQPINTLSGGESQRLKLVKHLAEAEAQASGRGEHQAHGAEQMDRTDFLSGNHARAIPGRERQSTLFLFDEPTTGLHFEDVRILLKVFQRLVDHGHSIIVIEHNLDVIKSADWVIDLGPDAGDQGGKLVAQGTPEEIAACEESHTGRALKSVLPAHVRRQKDYIPL
jgi:excinuclease ABC subunit A